MNNELTFYQWGKACIMILVLDFYFPPSDAERYFQMHPGLGPYQWEDGITPFEAVIESL